MAQIKVTRGTFIWAQIEIYEYTNRIFSVNVEHFSVDVEPYLLLYTYYCIPPPLAAAASVAALATVYAPAAVSAAAVSVDALCPPATAVLACPCRCHRCCLPALLTTLPPPQPPPLFLLPHRCHRCLFFCHRHHCLYVSTFPTASMLQCFSRSGRCYLCFDCHCHHSFRQDYH